MHSALIAPTPDPVPWVTAQMTRAGVFDTTTSDARRVKGALDVLTRSVSALQDEGTPYRVVLDKAVATAGTDNRNRLVQVGSKPLYDTSLTTGQQAAVLLGLVLHEVGHIRYARDYPAALRRYGIEQTGAVGAISNLAADHHNEAEAMRLFPGLAHAVEVTMWWVSRSIGDPVIDLSADISHRVNAAIAATRYPWRVDWDASPDLREWADWWTEWAGRAEREGKPKQHADLVAEAMAKVRDLPDPEPEPEPADDGDDETPTTDPDDTDDDPQDGPTGDDDGPEGDDGDGDDGDDTDDGDDDTGSESGDDEGTDEGDPEDGTDDGTDGDDDGDPKGEGDDDGDDADDGDDPTDDTGTGDAPDWSDDPTDTDDGDPSDGAEGDPDDGDDDGPTDSTGDGDDGEPGDGQDKAGDPDSDTGATGTPTDIDRLNEDGDDIEEACAAKAARDDGEDDFLQGQVESILASERLAQGVRRYHHSSSKYDTAGRTTVIARKARRGFTF